MVCPYPDFAAFHVAHLFIAAAPQQQRHMILAPGDERGGDFRHFREVLCAKRLSAGLEADLNIMHRKTFSKQSW